MPQRKVGMRSCKELREAPMANWFFKRASPRLIWRRWTPSLGSVMPALPLPTGGLKKLKVLNLEKTQVSDAGCAALARPLRSTAARWCLRSQQSHWIASPPAPW